MEFWLSPAVSIRDAIIGPKALARDGRGLILRAMAKTQCYNLFITYSNPQLELCSIKNHHFSNQNKEIRPCKARKVTPGHDNFSPFKLHDFRYQPGWDPIGGKHINTHAEVGLSPRI